jgi:PPOX class probable F420-dependent enzyme
MTVLDLDQPAHAAADARLQTEPILWLTTVTPAGQPQSTPVWFLWADGAFLVYGAANAPKTRSIAANPRVSLHLEGNGQGGANVIFEGTAALDPAGRRASEVPGYVEKYRALIARNGWTPDSFSDQYPDVIRVTVTRARIW